MVICSMLRKCVSDFQVRRQMESGDCLPCMLFLSRGCHSSSFSADGELQVTQACMFQRVRWLETLRCMKICLRILPTLKSPWSPRELRYSLSLFTSVTHQPHQLGYSLSLFTSVTYQPHQLGYSLSLPCLLYTSPSPRDISLSRMPSSA